MIETQRNGDSLERIYFVCFYRVSCAINVEIGL